MKASVARLVVIVAAFFVLRPFYNYDPWSAVAGMVIAGMGNFVFDFVEAAGRKK